jgi:hypothetical protein
MVLQLKKKANAASARITRNGNNIVHVQERVIVVRCRPDSTTNLAERSHAAGGSNSQGIVAYPVHYLHEVTSLELYAPYIICDAYKTVHAFSRSSSVTTQ